ncbi:unnamed protein product [Moneuplotes crassus]|uniref:Uncharacterized protein n=1 Tax=Euplotes crassus TaxID=5936 RepID=A0AAD2D7M4_EUPCR|nr:unnamed protein product [Moneuplotes crassus]
MESIETSECSGPREKQAPIFRSFGRKQNVIRPRLNSINFGTKSFKIDKKPILKLEDYSSNRISSSASKDFSELNEIESEDFGYQNKHFLEFLNKKKSKWEFISNKVLYSNDERLKSPKKIYMKGDGRKSSKVVQFGRSKSPFKRLPPQIKAKRKYSLAKKRSSGSEGISPTIKEDQKMLKEENRLDSRRTSFFNMCPFEEVSEKESEKEAEDNSDKESSKSTEKSNSIIQPKPLKLQRRKFSEVANKLGKNPNKFMQSFGLDSYIFPSRNISISAILDPPKFPRNSKTIVEGRKEIESGHKGFLKSSDNDISLSALSPGKIFPKKSSSTIASVLGKRKEVCFNYSNNFPVFRKRSLRPNEEDSEKNASNIINNNQKLPTFHKRLNSLSPPKASFGDEGRSARRMSFCLAQYDKTRGITEERNSDVKISSCLGKLTLPKIPPTIRGGKIESPLSKGFSLNPDSSQKLIADGGFALDWFFTHKINFIINKICEYLSSNKRKSLKEKCKDDIDKITQTFKNETLNHKKQVEEYPKMLKCLINISKKHKGVSSFKNFGKYISALAKFNKAWNLSTLKNSTKETSKDLDKMITRLSTLEMKIIIPRKILNASIILDNKAKKKTKGLLSSKKSERDRNKPQGYLYRPSALKI